MAGAVFLSYASQDADAAREVCEALRSAGVEAWFDQSELRGGDAWDQSIRRQIKACALFVPIVSANTQARREGYFRLEWKLAEDRSHLMAQGTPFILPICVDDTKDWEALVPDSFTAVQWTRLPGGRGAEAFAVRVQQILRGEGGPAAALPSPPAALAPPPAREAARQRRRIRWWMVAAMILGAIVLERRLRPQRSPQEAARAVSLAESIASAVDRSEDQRTAAAADASAGRQLVARARAMSLDKYNSTADDFAAAESLLKQALALDPNDAEAWAASSQLNTAFNRRGFDFSPARAEAARSQAERALKLAPDSVEALYAFARWQRDPAVAEKTYREVLRRAPNHAGALGSMGSIGDYTDRLQEALAFDERLALQPDNLPLARYEEFLAYFHRSYFSEAERCVRASIAAMPSVNSVAGLGILLLTSRGDPPAALATLAAIPVAERGDHRAVWVTAYAHLLARQPKEALKDLDWLSDDYIQDNWYAGPKAYWVGRAQTQAGRPEAARIAFETGLAVVDERLKAERGSVRLHSARGELLAWLGRTEEAAHEARTTAELTPEDEEFYWFGSVVRTYAVLGRADEAFRLLQRMQPPPGTDVGWPLTPALLRLDPLWDKLRGDARFRALLADRPPVAAPEAKK